MPKSQEKGKADRRGWRPRREGTKDKPSLVGQQPGAMNLHRP